MLKWIGRVLLILLAAAIINDGGRYVAARYRIDDVTRQMAFAASQAARDKMPGTNTGWPAAAKLAQGSGVEVTGYTQAGTAVAITTRVQVPGTWLAGPVIAWIEHKPLGTPLTISNEARSPS